MLDTKAAHRHSALHRAEILASGRCGCFYCRGTFGPGRIEQWIDDGQTALCPLCGVDAVVGDASGHPIDAAFLESMHRHWF